MRPWLGPETVSGGPEAALVGARLLADGVWYGQAFGLTRLTVAERRPMRDRALQMIEEGVRS